MLQTVDVNNMNKRVKAMRPNIWPDISLAAFGISQPEKVVAPDIEEVPQEINEKTEADVIEHPDKPLKYEWKLPSGSTITTYGGVGKAFTDEEYKIYEKLYKESEEEILSSEPPEPQTEEVPIITEAVKKTVKKWDRDSQIWYAEEDGSVHFINENPVTINNSYNPSKTQNKTYEEKLEEARENLRQAIENKTWGKPYVDKPTDSIVKPERKETLTKTFDRINKLRRGK
jgi:hypothetical protein